MLQSKLFKKLRTTLFELWLPLPLLALAFWGLSGIAMYTVINRSSNTVKYLQVEQPKLPPQIVAVAVPLRVVPKAIFVEVDKNRGMSRVKVQTKNSTLTEVVFEFPVTESSQIEAAISKALGMSHDEARNLIVK